MKPISGSTARCVQHLAKAIAGPDFYEKRQHIAEFVRVNNQAVHIWFSNEYLPRGEELMRLRMYLEFLGYDVEELRLLKPAVRDTARLYAFGVASLQEVAEFVGYEGDDGPHSLLKIFRGVRETSFEKLLQFTSFAEQHGPKLAQLQKKTPNVLGTHGTQVTSVSPIHVTGAVPADTPSFGAAGLRAEIVEVFGRMVSAMLPLAEDLLSDSFTATDRERVRELAGGDGVSRLSLALTKLSGENVLKALGGNRKEGGTK